MARPFFGAPAEADCCRGLAHRYPAPLRSFLWVESLVFSTWNRMTTIRLKTALCPRLLTTSFSKIHRPACPLRQCPAAQTRWSSATTEPRQPDADGRTHGEPSPQSRIKFTSESYASSAVMLWPALIRDDLDIPKSNGIANLARYEDVVTPKPCPRRLKPE